MNRELLYPLAVIIVVALVTWGVRAAPFILFGKRPLPQSMQYLGRVLPPAIMTVLVVYCLRSTEFGAPPFGLPEMISCLLAAVLQFARSNMYLSIIAGTLCYMILIRIV